MLQHSTAGPFELVIEPRSDAYSADDDRWRDQVAVLVSDLEHVAEIRQRHHVRAGAKGTITEVIVALGSAGAFTTTFEMFRAWLARDRDRRVDVRWDEDGQTHFVTLTGSAIDVDSVRSIAEAAARRVGGPQWPPSTERS
ncbi:hypothetical protein M6D93_11710 [Jatrophihabitans telluris]|uniref:Uncharacterized protein n=1 Tax=Jatrophihabitans telluris TaxID=2038343 RepID=A0ABY4QUP6_9ACTN|nr:hypothetical protein [Jatrophihabitans telluris]UQX86972.1 hypothetical protein M6D93_11710 [Jatrophihabitans telluris]